MKPYVHFILLSTFTFGAVSCSGKRQTSTPSSDTATSTAPSPDAATANAHTVVAAVSPSNTSAASGAELSAGAVDPASKPTNAFSTGDGSAAIREQIVNLLSEGSPLGEIVKLQLNSGQMSAAVARSIMKPLTPQENDKDFGPFVLDVKKLEMNLQTLQASEKISRAESVKEYQAAVEKLNGLFSEYLDALQKEGGQTLKGENRRAKEITQAVSSIR